MNENQIYDDVNKIITKSLFKSKYVLSGNHINSFNSFINRIKEIFFHIIKVEQFGTFILTDLEFIKNELNDDEDYLHHALHPNEARLRNMTYSVNVVCNLYFLQDVKGDKDSKGDKDNNGDKDREDGKGEKDTTNKNDFESNKNKLFLMTLKLFELPIMLGSEICHLNNLSKTLCFQLGECLYDKGGYFIMEGKEKMIPAYLASTDFEVKTDDCISILDEDNNTLGIYRNQDNQFFITYRNVEIPYCILMRLFGVETDKSIVEFIFLDIEGKNKDYLQELYETIYAAKDVFTQQEAYDYLEPKLQDMSMSVEMFLSLLLFKGNNYIQKAYNISYYIFLIITKRLKNQQRQRVSYCGRDLYRLFKSSFQQQRDIWDAAINDLLFSSKEMDLLYVKVSKVFENNKYISDTFVDYFENSFVDVDRRNYFTFVNQLLEIKNIKKNNYGFVFTDLLCVSCCVSVDYKTELLKTFLVSMLRLEELTPARISNESKVLLNDIWIGCLSDPLKSLSKLKMLKRIGLIQPFVSCYFDYKNNELVIWTDSGRLLRPLYFVEYDDISYKRQEHIQNSLFEKRENKNKTKKENKNKNKIKNLQEDEKQKIDDANQNEKQIIDDLTTTEKSSFYGDIMLYVNNISKPFFSKKKEQEQEEEVDEKKRKEDGAEILSMLKKKNVMDIIFDDFELKWHNITSGFFWKTENKDMTNYSKIEFHRFEDMKGIVDYICEEEQLLIMIAPNYNTFLSRPNIYNYIEMDPTFSLSLKHCYSPFFNQSGNIFSFSYNETSLYHSNYFLRMDKTKQSLLLRGQRPHVVTQYEEIYPIPFNGVNLLVAIMSNNNLISINQASINRGLLRSQTFETIEFVETENSMFVSNINTIANITQKRNWIDFSFLDGDGIVKRDTKVEYNTALFGLITKNEKNIFIETSLILQDFFSIVEEEQEEIFVDYTTIIKTENNKRIFKIRLRIDNPVELGDKVYTRNGLNGKIDEIIAECDMPYSQLGHRPDMILDPEFFLQQKCTGPIKEMYFSTLSTVYGGSVVINPFDRYKSHQFVYETDYHSENLQTFFDGYTGSQIMCNVYQGFLFISFEKQSSVSYKTNAFPFDKVSALGMTQYTQSIFPKVEITINPETGFISTIGDKIQLPIETFLDFQLLQTMNVQPRFITEGSYKSFENYSNKDEYENYESILTNIEHFKETKQSQKTLISSKRKMKKIKMKQIIQSRSQHDVNPDDEDENIDIEKIYQPEESVKSTTPDVQVVSMNEALKEQMQQQKQPEEVIKRKKIIMKPSIQSEEKTNTEEKTTEEKPSEKKSILDMDEETVKEDEDNKKEDENEGKRTITLSS